MDGIILQTLQDSHASPIKNPGSGTGFSHARSAHDVFTIKEDPREEENPWRQPDEEQDAASLPRIGFLPDRSFDQEEFSKWKRRR